MLHIIGFNSRAREGRDLAVKCVGKIKEVSTHAPARGATFLVYLYRYTYKFQLTRPRGARRYLIYLIFLLSCFNSRAREGRD